MTHGYRDDAQSLVSINIVPLTLPAEKEQEIPRDPKTPPAPLLGSGGITGELKRQRMKEPNSTITSLAPQDNVPWDSAGASRCKIDILQFIGRVYLA